MIKLVRKLKRSRTEIIQAILDIVQEETNLTAVMYKSFISYSQLKKYLDLLEKNGLITIDKKKKIKITSKGSQYLSTANKLSEMIKY
jgi:predicted transcriptional regulator